MTTKVICVLALALLLGACESEPSDAKPTGTPTVAATPAASPSPEATGTAAVAWKAGDRVNVTVDGKVVEATIVSIDEKTAKATVKVLGETKDRLVNLSELAKP